MSGFRLPLPKWLQGKKFVPTEIELKGGGIDQDAVLRMAAIAAVMSILDGGGEDPGLIGRSPGSAWAEDHLRMATGKGSLRRRQSGRSTWR